MITSSGKSGFYFKEFEPKAISPFDKLFDIFKELIVHTSGDFDEAIDWLRELDKEYVLTDEHYTIDDFIEDLKAKGYIKDDVDPNGEKGTALTAKIERAIRQSALDQIFGDIRKNGSGNHKSKATGQGDELTGEFRPYQFGDGIEKISLTKA
ncbi:MAG: hypothetical protein RLZZ504_878 [Bacteroidota bacterium]